MKLTPGVFFEAAGAVLKIDSSLKLNYQIKLNLSKSQIHTIDCFFFHNIICIRTNFIKKTINFENLEQNFKVAQYVECSKIIGGELATEGQFPYQVRTF